ncbi:MAG TPA: dihydrofolate reductase [Aestuariivirgaceae bacterium]|nr:dihydrofolate reductase [Aestuariivirgaceae bacterium]
MIGATPIAIVIIAAIAENRVIGSANAMPWQMKSDLRHFRSVTLNKPVIMGRKTLQAIGRALPQRTNVIVTRDPDFGAADVIAAPDLASALRVGRADALRRGVDEIIVAGGGNLYAQALPLADRLIITQIHAKLEGDVFFPEIDLKLWREHSREARRSAPGDDYDSDIVTYIRSGGCDNAA